MPRGGNVTVILLVLVPAPVPLLVVFVVMGAAIVPVIVGAHWALWLGSPTGLNSAM